MYLARAGIKIKIPSNVRKFRRCAVACVTARRCLSCHRRGFCIHLIPGRQSSSVLKVHHQQEVRRRRSPFLAATAADAEIQPRKRYSKSGVVSCIDLVYSYNRLTYSSLQPVCEYCRSSKYPLLRRVTVVRRRTFSMRVGRGKGKEGV